MIALLLAAACATDRTTETETLSLPGLKVVEVTALCDAGETYIEDPRLNEAIMLTTFQRLEDGTLQYNNNTRWDLSTDGVLQAFCYTDATLVVQMLLRQE